MCRSHVSIGSVHGASIVLRSLFYVADRRRTHFSLRSFFFQPMRAPVASYFDTRTIEPSWTYLRSRRSFDVQ